MGWSAAEGRCKKHPKHTQSPGVCSFCLRERLSQLSSSSNATTVSGSCSSSTMSSYSSVSASSSSPPPLHFSSGSGARKGRRLSFPATAAEAMFGRSRSVAVVVGRGGEGGMEKTKKVGFWSKLLRVKSRRRKEEGFLQYSKTMKEVTAN